MRRIDSQNNSSAWEHEEKTNCLPSENCPPAEADSGDSGQCRGDNQEGNIDVPLPHEADEYYPCDGNVIRIIRTVVFPLKHKCKSARRRHPRIKMKQYTSRRAEPPIQNDDSQALSA
jgi:hypothetical protein